MWGRISTTCVESLWRYDTKCKYMFMFSLKNLARKGLIPDTRCAWKTNLPQQVSNKPYQLVVIYSVSTSCNCIKGLSVWLHKRQNWNDKSNIFLLYTFLQLHNYSHMQWYHPLIAAYENKIMLGRTAPLCRPKSVYKNGEHGIVYPETK